MPIFDPLDSVQHYESIAFLYDSLHENRTADIKFWIEHSLQYGGPVLELGCGTGRLPLPIADAGVPITGLEASEEMLKILYRRRETELNKAARDRIQIIHGRFPDAIPSAQFQQVFVPFGTLQCLMEGQIELFERIREVLVQDGKVVVDVADFGGDNIGWQRQPKLSFSLSNANVSLSREVSYNSTQQQITKVFTLYITYLDGTKETVRTQHRLRTYARPELEQMIKESGFRITATYGDYRRTLPRPASTPGRQWSGRLIVIGQPN